MDDHDVAHDDDVVLNPVSSPTPDRRTMLINIQHPGEDGGRIWPQDDGLSNPRSATLS